MHILLINIVVLAGFSPPSRRRRALARRGGSVSSLPQRVGDVREGSHVRAAASERIRGGRMAAPWRTESRTVADGGPRRGERTDGGSAAGF